MTSRTTRKLAWLGLPLLLAGLSCEHRVEEPLGNPSSKPKSATHPAAPASVASAVRPAPSAAITGKPSPGRCIKPLPDEPERKVDPGPAEGCPPDPGRPKLPMGEVFFDEAQDGKGAHVRIEHAKDDEYRQRGLMYRTSMPEDDGMLFSFEQRRVLTFWMKNTCIPLDMIFIDEDFVVVGIEENVPTLNTRTYHVGCPSLYVLEVNAGWSRRHGVKPGQRARFVLPDDEAK
ncbi:MAG: DUF192 domain-containing protein [Polyangiaceae bacterium]